MTELNEIFRELCKECYNHRFDNLKYIDSDVIVNDIFHMSNDKTIIATLNLRIDYSDIRCVVGKVKPTVELYKLINDINVGASFVKCIVEKESLVINYCVMTVYEYDFAFVLRDALDEIKDIINKLNFNTAFSSVLIKQIKN